MDNKKIGTLIAKLRKEKQMTQQELGDKVGVGSRAVSKWECGITIPDISIINELSKILGISSDELLSGKIKESKETKNKKKLSTKLKVLIISITILIVSGISLFIYYSNKTYVYRINAKEYEKYKIDGYATYKNGTFALHINNFEFNSEEFLNLKINDYQYDIKFDNKIILGYGQTQEDINSRKIYTIIDIEDVLKISYTGKTKLSKNELLEKNIYIMLTLWDDDNNEIFNEIEIALYEKKK